MRFQGRLGQVLRFLICTLAVTGVIATRSDQRVGARTSDPVSWVCFPTCSTVDARFLVMSGTEVHSLGDQTISIGLSAAPGSADIHIGVFDGDNGGMWDD